MLSEGDVEKHIKSNDNEVREKLEIFVRAAGALRPAKIAQRLVEECGSAAAVFGAPRHRIELAVGKRSSVGAALRSARWLSLHSFEKQAQQRPLIASKTALVNYLGVAMAHDEVETMRVLYVDAQLRLLNVEVAHRGSRHACSVEPRYILRRALELGAHGLILAHNHPSGDQTPSEVDIQLTNRIANCCADFDVHLVDHIVVGPSGAKSVIWDREFHST